MVALLAWARRPRSKPSWRQATRRPEESRGSEAGSTPRIAPRASTAGAREKSSDPSPPRPMAYHSAWPGRGWKRARARRALEARAR